MGKVRAKSSAKSKSNEIKMAPASMDRNNKPSTSTSGMNLTSGRIKKPSKKSVTFRSNLTDVVSAEDVLRGGRIVSGGFVDPASSISENSVSLSGPINLSRLGKTLKEVVKDKKQRKKVRREAFMKKIESVKVAEKEAKDAAKRKATPIVGDTKALMDALPAPVPAATNSGLNPLMDLAGFVEAHNLEEFKSIPKKKFNTKQRQREIAEGLEYFASALNCQPPTL